MEFHLIAVGRLREPRLRSVCDGYADRIRRYVRFAEHDVPDTQGRRSPTEIARAEGRAILARVPPQARAVALTRSGRQMDSIRFAERFEQWEREARDVAFVLGGAFGLHAEVLDRCETHLALSDMTFPHDLARLILLEQIYRANTIRRGEPYHKGG